MDNSIGDKLRQKPDTFEFGFWILDFRFAIADDQFKTETPNPESKTTYRVTAA